MSQFNEETEDPINYEDMPCADSPNPPCDKCESNPCPFIKAQVDDDNILHQVALDYVESNAKQITKESSMSREQVVITIGKINDQYQKQVITPEERFNRIIDTILHVDRNNTDQAKLTSDSEIVSLALNMHEANLIALGNFLAERFSA